MTKPPTLRVSCTEIQRLCRECNCLSWLPKLTRVLSHNQHAKPQSGQVAGTMSQIIKCYDESEMLVLVVHQFVRPDGTIGASGKPDPKRIVQNGIDYVC